VAERFVRTINEQCHVLWNRAKEPGRSPPLLVSRLRSPNGGRASLGLTDTMELRCHRPALTGSAGSDDRRGELSRTLEFMPMNLDAQVRGYSAKPEGFLPGGSP
jgi:hypothetical protein